MTQHKSLKPKGAAGGRHRSVLKRFERIKILEKSGRWKEADSIYCLPKVKSQKLRVKKEKTEAEVKGAAATTTTATASAPAPPPKPEKSKKEKGK